MINLVPKKQWVVYLLWLFLLVFVLAGIWWYYSRRIDNLDRQIQGALANPTADHSHPLKFPSDDLMT